LRFNGVQRVIFKLAKSKGKGKRKNGLMGGEYEEDFTH